MLVWLLLKTISMLGDRLLTTMVCTDFRKKATGDAAIIKVRALCLPPSGSPNMTLPLSATFAHPVSLTDPQFRASTSRQCARQ